MTALLRSARRKLGRLRHEARCTARQLADHARWRGRPTRHGLPAPLIVSLTSYPPRFATLHRTIRSLLRQSVVADRTILWIAEGDIAALPERVSELAAGGLEIRPTRELRSYKKLLPAVAAFPDAFVVTADDDVHYPHDWLATLVGGWDGARPSILCWRAHRPTLRPGSMISPYAQWRHDVQDESARRLSGTIVPTGVGGVLYPPGAFHPDLFNEETFTRLCPDCDDFWFFWMARRAGMQFRKVGGRFPYVDWPGSQVRTLHVDNLAAGYDRQIAALCDRFGLPPGLGE